jgi:hypothetical protein
MTIPDALRNPAGPKIGSMHSVEHPGPVNRGDLDRECGLCGAMLGALTVFRVASDAALDR